MKKEVKEVIMFFLFLLFSELLFCQVHSVDYGAKFFEPTREVVTPHIKWLNPYYKGPIRGFFIIPRVEMRDVIEISQRLELNYDVFCFYKWDRLPGPFSSTNPAKRVSKEEREQKLKEKLKKNYDIIVIGDVYWNRIPLFARYEILKKVKEGSGLILSYLCAKKRDKYLKMAMKIDLTIPENISSDIPWKGLPAYKGYNSSSQFLSSTVEAKKFGKGKIILLKYNNPLYQRSPFTPGITVSPLKVKLINYDYYLGYLIKLILFASNKEPEIKVISKEGFIKKNRENFSSLKFIINSPIPKEVFLQFVVRDKDNNIYENQDRKVSLTSGENKIRFSIRKLPAGEYFADLWVKEKGNIINFASTYINITSRNRIISFTLEKDNFKKEEAVNGKVKIEVVRLNLKLRICQIDNYGRFVREEIFSPKSEGYFKEIFFEIPPSPKPLSIIQHLKVELLSENGEILDIKRNSFALSNLYPKNDIRYFIWQWAPYNFTALYFLKEIRNTGGFDTILCGRTNPLIGFNAFVPLANLYALSYCVRIVPKETTNHIRKPCLVDPEYRKFLAETLAKCVMERSKFSNREYNMGDECLFCNYRGNYELCFAPYSQKFFQDFLMKEYGSVEKMNEEYGTNYRSFSEVKPILLEDAKKSPNLIPLWVDFRRCMESEWADIYRFCRETIQKIIPEAKVGYEGSDSHPINSFMAADYYKLMKAMNFNNIYEAPFVAYAVKDFSQPGTLLGLGWYGGYNPCRNVPFNRYISWHHLFRGANAFGVWMGFGTGVDNCGTVIAPDYSFYDFFKANIKEVKEIKRGIGKLLMCSKRDNNRIAFLYSPSSVHASTLTPEFPPIEDVYNKLVTLIEDAGFGLQVISSAQLEEGILNREYFQLLLLPFSQAISQKEAEEIISFVKKGGIVIADLRPGVCDKHGKPYKKGVLDKLFGIEQNTGKPEVKKGRVFIKDKNYPQNLLETFTDSSLKLTESTARGMVAGVPVFLTNNYGKGKSILLNFSLAGYKKENEGSFIFLPFSEKKQEKKDEKIKRPNESILLFFKKLLNSIGIKEKIRINPDIPNIRKYRFICGSLAYLGFLQELPEPPINYSLGIARPLVKRKIKVYLLRKNHIYNVRERKYLGYTDKFQTEIEPGVAQFYSLLPYKVEGIEIDLPESLSQGDELKYSINLKATEEPETHIFHISIINLQGKELSYYADNLISKRGKYKGKITLALNEEPGTYQFKVRDIATGLEITKSFKVKRSKQ